jgi:hypothetical protein
MNRFVGIGFDGGNEVSSLRGESRENGKNPLPVPGM